jgi:1-deoxy-D-xylulose-5-phosphate reductoisomerase
VYIQVRNISIIGSTGSIGTQTLEVVRANGDLNVVALAAGENAELLEKQAREFKPDIVGIWSEDKALQLRKVLSEFNIRVVSGMEGLIEVAAYSSADITVTAVVGMIGIRPTIAAINAGKDIALANKETLVTAGHIIMPLAKEKNVRILPVDSEHSAIFQCLHGEEGNQISRILLTASGGPVRNKTKSELENVTVADALNHPNWSMGRKITIDSATMVNKGLEVIEAKWLFGVDAKDIEVVVQPQSIIHSMVEFADGGIKAQLGTPDMKLPIQYALYYPERRNLPGDRLDFGTMGSISVQKPDMDTFLGLKLAYEAIEAGGSMPTVFNAANERAVAMFLDGKIKFLQIYDIIKSCMHFHKVTENPSLDDILEIEQWTYLMIQSQPWIWR